MASVQPGYEYDIFISYRHNDNRSGWVTEFVNALQEELAATIKEPLSIYFDKNEHDGLLENHHVDKSLEGKLKCLIFIPILSQTYCDPKSFAWQHEFCAFNNLALNDPFGRDIKLANGNVTSRILPIKIHDLDAEDKSIIENEIKGILRAIEFIYKEPGVNRPLKLTDSRSDNQNKTDYRNQVNKAANAIKEIIGTIKNPRAERSTPAPSPAAQQPSSKKWVIAGLAVLLIAAGYFTYQMIFANHDQAVTNKSIAVLPFQNLSGDPEQEYFSDGISEEILNALTHLEGLQVTGRSSSFQFKGKNLDLKEVGEKLAVATVLEGSVRKQGDQVRITVQLVNTSNGYHLWSERYDRKITDIFAVQDEIAQVISSKLKLTLLNQSPAATGTQNQEAYDLFLKGRYFFNQRGEGLFKGRDLLKQAIALDSTYSPAYATLALDYALLTFYYMIPSTEGVVEGRKYADLAIALDPNSSDAYAAMAFIELFFERNDDQARKSLMKALQLNPGDAFATQQLGNYYQHSEGDFKKADSLYMKALVLDPLYAITYSNLAALRRMDDPVKALEYAEKGLELNKTSVILLTSKANCLWKLSRQSEAIESLEQGLPLTGRHQNLIALLSELHSEAGHQDNVRALYDELIKRQHTEYIAAFNLGRVAFALGKEQEAKAWFIKAYEERNSGLFGRHVWKITKFNDLIDQLGLE